MKIRFVRVWRMWQVGAEADLQYGVAEQLIRRGIAVAAEPDAPAPECATVEARETAVKRRPRKRKGAK